MQSYAYCHSCSKHPTIDIISEFDLYFGRGKQIYFSIFQTGSGITNVDAFPQVHTTSLKNILSLCDRHDGRNDH